VFPNPRLLKLLAIHMRSEHNLERSADRVTNICERAVYMVTGKMEEIGVSKY